MIEDKWFKYYGLSNKVTFDNYEYVELLGVYPQIHELHRLEHFDLIGADANIKKSQNILQQAINRKKSLRDSIGENRTKLSEFVTVWDKLKSDTGSIHEYAKYRIKSEGVNLSSIICEQITNLNSIDVGKLSLSVESQLLKKEYILNNISSIRSDYGI